MADQAAKPALPEPELTKAEIEERLAKISGYAKYKKIEARLRYAKQILKETAKYETIVKELTALMDAKEAVMNANEQNAGTLYEKFISMYQKTKPIRKPKNKERAQRDGPPAGRAKRGPPAGAATGGSPAGAAKGPAGAAKAGAKAEATNPYLAGIEIDP